MSDMSMIAGEYDENAHRRYTQQDVFERIRTSRMKRIWLSKSQAERDAMSGEWIWLGDASGLLGARGVGMGVGEREKVSVSVSVDVSMAMAMSTTVCRILDLPSELILQILSHLPPVDLAQCMAVNKQMYSYSTSESLWQEHILSNIKAPGKKMSSSYPYSTYRDLYIAHDPYWFLTRHFIWLGDSRFVGDLVIARFDPRRGCIEGYRLVASRPSNVSEAWERDGRVRVCHFAPKCSLHMDYPVVRLNAKDMMDGDEHEANKSRGLNVLHELMRANHDPETEENFAANLAPSRYELPRAMANPLNTLQHSIRSMFLLAKAKPQDVDHSDIWPPRTIPSPAHVITSRGASCFGPGARPRTRKEVCEVAFRVKKFIQPAAGLAMRLGSDVTTFSTLDPILYTPTPDYPLRGIWVGDYNGHGSEFLLLHQPTVEPEELTPVPVPYANRDWELWNANKPYLRGHLEAIKLTGDPNIPRGEYTWLANLAGGLVRVAEEAPFEGALVVKGWGHIAGDMYSDDMYIDSEVIIIDDNTIAQHWTALRVINYYRRVDLSHFHAPLADLARLPYSTGT